MDVGAPLTVTLGGLDFDGVTKRNKPNLQIGSVVYCRIVEYSKFVGGKASCLNKGYTTKNSNSMGELKGGSIIWIPVHKHNSIQPYL